MAFITSLTKEGLQATFSSARHTGAPYVFVSIRAEGVDEVIAIPRKSFAAKEAFYMKAYTDDLVHCMNERVYVRGLGYGDVDQIQYML